MKKFGILFMLFIFCFILIPPADATVNTTPAVILNDTPLSFDVPPKIENGRTLVPLRAIFEALGATVEWDGNTKTVTAYKAGTVIKLQIGNKTAFKNNQAVDLDVPAKIENGRTLVPLRFISESLGCEVNWNGTNRRVLIKSSPSPEAKNRINAVVTRVIDGDTIEVNINGRIEKVRLIGVDTPETVHPTRGEEPYGREASNFTKSQLEGKSIELEFDVQERDRYGRLLAYVWLNGTLFNKTLVEQGYAQVATFPPNVKYVDIFTETQKQARENNRGLWGITEQVKEEPIVKTEGKYVGSLQSDKYHLPSCRWAEKISPVNQIWFDTKEEAEKAGYKPCGVCKP